MRRNLPYIFRVAASAFIVLTFDAVTMAQCAMCRASLNGSNNAHFIRNLNIGILVLLTPPVAMFCVIFVVLRRQAPKADGNESGAGRP